MKKSSVVPKHQSPHSPTGLGTDHCGSGSRDEGPVVNYQVIIINSGKSLPWQLKMPGMTRVGLGHPYPTVVWCVYPRIRPHVLGPYLL